VTDERITTRDLSDDEIEDRLLAALRGRDGRGSEADLVVDSGLAPEHVGPGLRRLLIEYRSHLDVQGDGTLIYRFDPGFVRRSARPGVVLRTALQVLWGVFVVAFKVMTGLVLLGYVGIFALLFLLFLAGARILAVFRLALDSVSEPNRLQRARDFVSSTSRDAASLAQKIFAFTFGPPQRPADEFADERYLLAYVRAQKGVLSPDEIIAQTGWTTEVADQESTRLVARYGGDVEIVDGQAVYVFPDLMGGDGTETPCPPPCWERLEQPVAITGNTTSTDGSVIMLNLWVLIASALIFPLYIAPNFDVPLEVPEVRLWMIEIPALYAVGSFLIHIVRRRKVARPENLRRLQRNLRRLILREAFAGRNPHPRADLLAGELQPFPVRTTRAEVERLALAVASELKAEISIRDAGAVDISWNELASSLAAAAARRARVPCKAPAEVIFSSDDPVLAPT
jgi:hypothetical protein